MPRIFLSNDCLRERLEQLRSELNSGCWLRLFAGNLVPTPATLRIDFPDASFPGYSPQALTDAYGAPIKLFDGAYQISTVTHTFTCTANNSGTCYGWFVTKGGDWLIASRFDFPIALNSGTEVSFSMPIQELSS